MTNQEQYSVRRGGDKEGGRREALSFGAEALEFMRDDRRDHYNSNPEDFDHDEPEWTEYDRAAAILREMAKEAQQ